MTKKKILIVEDDQDMRRALNVRLRANNYDTTFASDAIEALSVAKKAARSGASRPWFAGW